MLTMSTMSTITSFDRMLYDAELSYDSCNFSVGFIKRISRKKKRKLSQKEFQTNEVTLPIFGLLSTYQPTRTVIFLWKESQSSTVFEPSIIRHFITLFETYYQVNYQTYQKYYYHFINYDMIDTSYKREILRLVNKNIRIHHLFSMMCQKIIIQTQKKFRGVQFNPIDLLGDPISPTDPNTFSLYSREMNGYWVLSLDSLQKIFQNHLLPDISSSLNSSMDIDEIFETIDLHSYPTIPKNPYNNEILTYQQLTNICKRFSFSPRYYKRYIKVFQLSNFCKQIYYTNYCKYLINNTINQIPSQLSQSQFFNLLTEIFESLPKYFVKSICFRCIFKKFTKEMYLDIFQDVVKLYFYKMFFPRLAKAKSNSKKILKFFQNFYKLYPQYIMSQRTCTKHYSRRIQRPLFPETNRKLFGFNQYSPLLPKYDKQLTVIQNNPLPTCFPSLYPLELNFCNMSLTLRRELMHLDGNLLNIPSTDEDENSNENSFNEDDLYEIESSSSPRPIEELFPGQEFGAPLPDFETFQNEWLNQPEQEDIEETEDLKEAAETDNMEENV